MAAPSQIDHNTRRWASAAVGAVVLFAASVTGAWYFWPERPTAPQAKTQPRVVETQPPADPAAIRRQAWDRIARRLAPADAESLAEIDRALLPIDRFFDERRGGAREFAAAVLGLRGKWKYVKSRRLLGGDAEDHLAFLDEKFRQHVFEPKALENVIRTAIADYLRTVHGIENRLLVAVRADLNDLDPLVESHIQGLESTDAFTASYERTVNKLAADVAQGTRAEIGQFVGSLVAAEVTEQLVARLGRAIATRLGLSAGVLGAGASGGAASAGVTIGLAIVIDMGIEWAMRLTGADATTKVTARVEQSLDELRDFILEGDTTAVEAYHKILARRDTFPTAEGRRKIDAALQDMEAKGHLGLRQMLFQLHQRRSHLREQALKKLILEGATT
jgi:hypothetical protein